MDELGRESRRRFLTGFGALAGSGILGRTNCLRGFEAEPGQAVPGGGAARVLALVGDRYHNADYIRTALNRLFLELRLPIDFTINFSEIDATHLQNCQLLIMFRDGLNWPGGYLEPDDYAYSSYLENSGEWPKEEYQGWITEEQGKAIKAFVEAGGSLYAYHNSSNISLFSKHFREVMGGAYLGHPALRPFKVKVLNHGHPVTQGVQDFMVNDEQHYVVYDKDSEGILLRSENIDGSSFETYGATAISAWAYDYGKGRVVFTAVGHTLHALWQPEYYKLQKNAVRWLLRLP
jgi:type 1 glutamine amidotransferase